jgi:unsaturated rhamnogalacturonyl hydrolase
MPTELHGIKASDVHATVKLLIHNLVNIKDTTGEFLLKLDDGRIIDTKGWNDWEWTHGIGLYGMWKYHELTGDEDSLRIIEAWFRDRFAEGHKGKNINTMAVFLTLAYLYEKTRDATYLPWLDSWAEWAYRDLPRTKYGGMQHITYLEVNDQQLWDDTLMMTVLPLAKIGLVLGRPHYVAEAKRQFLLHIQYLFDTKTGLFFHGWTFADAGHNFARARWARGNSWITIVIPEFLDLLSLSPTSGQPGANSLDDDPIASHLVATLVAQCEALAPLQTEAGLWRTLLDVSEDEGSYPEASATAGFAYGILKARRRRLVGIEFEPVAVRAVQAVLDNVSPDGELLNTSFGTGMGHDLQHYLDIPRTSMPYGQAMAIMALVEFLRVFI